MWQNNDRQKSRRRFCQLGLGHRLGGRGSAAPQKENHFGFAVESRQAVDDAIAKGREDGAIIWAPEDVPFPIGYYCGLMDPNGNTVEISYGHPIRADIRAD